MNTTPGTKPGKPGDRRNVSQLTQLIRRQTQVPQFVRKKPVNVPSVPGFPGFGLVTRGFHDCFRRVHLWLVALLSWQQEPADVAPGYDGCVGPQLPQISFEIVAECPHTRARAGLLHTPHGTIETPVFMPVGTQATVKGLTQRDLAEDLGVGILLANTYHLYLRPGHELIRRMGGLHKFMS